jgi:hypothetical protein
MNTVKLFLLLCFVPVLFVGCVLYCLGKPNRKKKSINENHSMQGAKQ